MLRHELRRLWVAAAQGIDELLVVAGIGSPGIRGMATEQHARLGGEGLVRPGETLAAGEADQFASALAGEDEPRCRLQLKTLLFGMGESFRTLLQKEKGPDESGPE